MSHILNHQIVTAEGASPSRFAFVLHGVLGMGTNFRGIVKAVAARDPSWGFVLVDLRGHGASQGFEPPHTLAAAARDLSVLQADKGLDIRAIMGHSFGGKVALAYLEQHPLEAAIILDSMPGARSMDEDGETASKVLSTLETVSPPWPSREVFQEALRSRGFSRGIIEWLTMNVRREGEGYTLRLDLPAIRSMLEDYLEQDLWHVLERPGAARSLSLVIAGRSTVFDAAARERANAAAQANPALSVVVLAEAGHWLHVDDPSGVIDAATQALARVRSPIGS